MVWLLPIFLLFSQVQVYELATSYELRSQLRDDACERAEAIARRGPCTSPENCPAYNEWRFMMGVPGIELLEPELAQARTVPAGVPSTSDGTDHRSRFPPGRDRPFVCPAGARR